MPQISAFMSLGLGFLTPTLAACVSTSQDLATQKIATAEECAVGKCRFHNAPLQLQPDTVRIRGRLYDFNRLAATLQFTDGVGQAWEARKPNDPLTAPHLDVPPA